MATKHDVDAVSGVSTTGHEWDGIRELNNPLPRWWLWSFYVTILWAVAYWIVYPAWPLITTHTKGIIGYSSRANVAQELADLQALRGAVGARMAQSSLEEIVANPEMLAFARAQGRAAFGDNCAPCHGVGAAGSVGFPNLNDDDWLWGGKLADIQATITHGIRNADQNSRQGNMPAFGRDGLLKRPEVTAVAAYVQKLAGVTPDPKIDLALGQKVWADNCAACHGDEGKGNRDLGAPSLVDRIWLFGSDRAAIEEGIWNGRGSVMPSWAGRLDEGTIKALTVYVHSLGGGE
jgi:cytochrome c oxidase cbb3-type subunit 3